MTSDYYNGLYSKNKQYFGDHPDNLLRDYFSLCDKNGRILDVGIGQGRNAWFLLQQGFGVDGIDISSIAIDNLKTLAVSEGLNLRLFHQSFEDYDCPARTYSAIMIFGVFPVLSVEQINILARKTQRWLKRGGILFVTGFTPQEKHFRPNSPEWSQIDPDTYTDHNGSFRTFIDMPDATAKFTRLKPIYQWQGYGEMHHHGTDQLEQHHIFEIILQKNKFW